MVPDLNIWARVQFLTPTCSMFFDALRKPDYGGQNTPKVPHRAAFGKTGLSNPVKKQALARKSRELPPEKIFGPPVEEARWVPGTPNYSGELSVN